MAAYSPLGGQGADNPLFNDSSLAAVAKQYNHTIVQILIAWGLKRGYAVLAKSFTPERIEANFKVVDLSDEEYEAVGEAVGDRRKRTCPVSAFPHCLRLPRLSLWIPDVSFMLNEVDYMS